MGTALMSKKVVPILVASTILAAAGFALLHGDDTRAESREVPVAAPATAEAPATQLPPGDPAVGSLGSPNGGSAFAPGKEPATLGWTVPATWHSMPNPNALRIETYRVSANAADPTEVTVARAGGTTEANIQRWIAQFDQAGAETRTERKVGDLTVTGVEVSGRYLGNAMMPDGKTAPLDGWTLVGAIVSGKGTPYFFKMIGPTASVRAARRAFDAMINSINPL